MTFSVDGLVSGLDTATIIEGALSLQQSRVDRLNLERQEITEQQAAFKNIEGQLFSLRGSLRGLVRTTNSAFEAMTAEVSDETAVEVSASTDAAAGTYRIRVNQLAQAHQIKSDGLDRASDLVGTGTLTLRVGNRAETDIVVAEGTTLQGLADTINAQSSDILASVVDDGSESESAQLLLTSRHSGSANEISVTGTLDLGGGNSFGFSPDAVQDALNAELQIGSGAGAITISSENNQFDGVLPGLTLDALQADAGKEIVITVSQDTTSVVESVEGFVESYNSVIEFIGSNSRFDSDSETAGIFLGDRTANSVVSTLQSAVGSVLQGVDSDINTLSRIGISTNNDGSLRLDRSRLEDILEGRVDGAGIQDLRRLFAIDGVSDNPGVEFVLGTSKTQSSPIDPATGLPRPYQVEINTAADSAIITAAASLLETTVINDGNNQLKIEVDGIELTLTIPDGSYARQDLADQLESLINTSPDRSGRSVEVSVNASNELVIQSDSFGADSSISILDGTGNPPLGFNNNTSDNGTNVGGVFRVDLGDGEILTETAAGNGRLLSGGAGNEYTADLRVRSTLTSAQISDPIDANLTITRGIGANLDAAIEGILNLSSGQLASVQDRFTAQLDDIDRNIDLAEERIETRRNSLLAEFAALESTLGELQSAGDSITSSLLNFR